MKNNLLALLVALLLGIVLARLFYRKNHKPFEETLGKEINELKDDISQVSKEISAELADIKDKIID